MRVLGIDPGLTRCGVGVVDGEVGRPLQLVDVEVIRTVVDRRRRAAGEHRAGDRRLARRAPARRGRDGAGVRPVTTSAR